MDKINWKEELNKLREYIEKKKMTFEEVGKLYGKPKQQIEVVCLKYGIKYAHRKVFPWSKEEINIVRENLSLGKTYREISKLLPRRTEHAIRALYEYHKEEYDLIKPAPRKLELNESETNIVKSLLIDGYLDCDIMRITGLSYIWISRIKEDTILPSTLQAGRSLSKYGHDKSSYIDKIITAKESDIMKERTGGKVPSKKKLKKRKSKYYHPDDSDIIQDVFYGNPLGEFKKMKRSSRLNG